MTIMKTNSQTIAAVYETPGSSGKPRGLILVAERARAALERDGAGGAHANAHVEGRDVTLTADTVVELQLAIGELAFSLRANADEDVHGVGEAAERENSVAGKAMKCSLQLSRRELSDETDPGAGRVPASGHERSENPQTRSPINVLDVVENRRLLAPILEIRCAVGPQLPDIHGHRRAGVAVRARERAAAGDPLAP